MRIFAVLFLVACTTSHGSPAAGDDAPAPTCPATAATANGAPCEGELQCTYAESATRNLYCTCQSGRLWCSDCDANAYGFGACSAGESCSYSSWETDCACSCTVRGNWNCTSSDAVSPCPRDPGP